MLLICSLSLQPIQVSATEASHDIDTHVACAVIEHCTIKEGNEEIMNINIGEVLDQSEGVPNLLFPVFHQTQLSLCQVFVNICIVSR